VSCISNLQTPLIPAFQSEPGKSPCGLQVQCKCTQDDCVATLEPKHNHIELMCDKALLYDELNTWVLAREVKAARWLQQEWCNRGPLLLMGPFSLVIYWLSIIQMCACAHWYTFQTLTTTAMAESACTNSASLENRNLQHSWTGSYMIRKYLNRK